MYLQVFFTTDAALYFQYAPLAAAHFPMDQGGERHFNAGLMVLRPSVEKLAMIRKVWHAGNFTAVRGFSDLTDQDLLMDTFTGQVHTMDVCDNFRGRHRPYQRHCTHPPALHNVMFTGVATRQMGQSSVCGKKLYTALRQSHNGSYVLEVGRVSGEGAAVRKHPFHAEHASDMERRTAADRYSTQVPGPLAALPEISQALWPERGG